MEQFNALPFPQRVGILVGAMVAVAGLFYYSLIIPLDEAKAAAVQGKEGLATDIAALKERAGDYTPEQLAKEKADLEAEKKRFQNLLPRRKELEKFITSISETARNAGLQLISFKKGDLASRDYYMEIPIEMEVNGTFRELIGFLRTISEKDQRIINIRNMAINRGPLPVEEIVAAYAKRRAEETPEGVGRIELDPAAKLMEMVRAHEDAIQQGVKLKVTFTAHVFSYTGEKAKPDDAKEHESEQKSKQQQRSEFLSK